MSNRAFTDEKNQEIVEALFKYRDDNNLTISQIAETLECDVSNIYAWRKNGRPSVRMVMRMNEAGITDVDIPEAVRQEAIQKEIAKKDRKNQAPRPYKRRVSVPDVVRNQIKLMLDDYVTQLEVPKTFSEFRQAQDEFIDKLVITCNKES